MPGDWTGIHRSWLYSDYNSWETADFFESEFKKLIDAEARNTNALITSNKNLVRDFETHLHTSVGDVAHSVHQTNKMFDARFSEIIWVLEQQNVELVSILNKIYREISLPTTTRAKEYRERGNTAYANGWFSDAKRDYLLAIENNPYDFSVYHSLGNLYFFDSEKKSGEQRKKDCLTAVDYYHKAMKYAQPYSKEFVAFSGIHLAQVYSQLKDYNSAYSITNEITRLTPGFLEAKYLHAQNCVQVNRKKEAIDNILDLLEKKILFALFIDRNPIFAPISSEIRAIYLRLINNYHTEANIFIKKVTSLLGQAKNDNFHSEDLPEVAKSLNSIQELCAENNLFSSYLASKEAKKLYTDVLNHMKEYWTKKRNEISTIECDNRPIIVDYVVSIIPWYLIYSMNSYYISNWLSDAAELGSLGTIFGICVIGVLILCAFLSGPAIGFVTLEYVERKIEKHLPLKYPYYKGGVGIVLPTSLIILGVELAGTYWISSYEVFDELFGYSVGGGLGLIYGGILVLTLTLAVTFAFGVLLRQILIDIVIKYKLNKKLLSKGIIEARLSEIKNELAESGFTY